MGLQHDFESIPNAELKKYRLAVNPIEKQAQQDLPLTSDCLWNNRILARLKKSSPNI